MNFIHVSKKIGIIVFTLSLLFSCNSTDMKSYEERENFVKQYLQNKYASEFEMISLNRENAPGEKVRNFTAQFRSLTYDRRKFYVSFSGNDSLKINVDQFPIILLEHAFLENLNIENKDYPFAFEIQNKLINKEQQQGVNNINDAKSKLLSIADTSWDLYIYTIVSEPKENMEKVEEMIIDMLAKANEILPARLSAHVYIYDDTSLTKTDIQPDMNKGIVTRTPHKDKLYEEWSMGWNQSMLEKYDNGFQTVVEKRRLIPHF